MTGRILVKMRGTRGPAMKAFAAQGMNPELVLDLGNRPGLSAAKAAPVAWYRVDAPAAGTPWDAAHALLTPGTAFAPGLSVEGAEPDIEQSWDWAPRPGTGMALAAGGDRCLFTDQDDTGGKAKGPGLAWQATDDYSQFAKARKTFGPKFEEALRRVTIAHLDTGYDPTHVTLPLGLDGTRQKSFVKGDPDPNSAVDHVPPGQSAMSNRGHGTATLALLAGNRLDGTSPSWQGSKDFIGAAPYAQVIPIRIADWVVRFTTGTMVQGVQHALACKADILTMSMGGLTSAALADAVNAAYEAGLFMVTAAGNNYAGLPSPKSIVFPARFDRVLAACGVMADGRAYAGLAFRTMQGNYGPDHKMATALGAFTPNVPWAVIDCGKVVGMDGAGTSSATPQIAAAAALWLALNRDAVMAYPKPWMRVEAIRRALFAAASKSTARMNADETHEKIGQGVLRADAALGQKPAKASILVASAVAKESWGWLDLVLGADGPAVAASPARLSILKLELTQMGQRHAVADLAAIAAGDADSGSGAARRRYLEWALDEGQPSTPLKQVLEDALQRKQAGGTAAKKPVPVIEREMKQMPPPRRRLRIFALDPSIGKELSSVDVNETTLAVRWEDIAPGPVGEYLEVVDVDPASDRLYSPVNLNDPLLLAQDGIAPSEGNPKFHQQMVYAVAMRTIERFEDALGRRALWAPRYAPVTKADGTVELERYEVPRLRLYPHALRTDNAYYSPAKVAVLFGYFPAASARGAVTTAGTMVFSCLSSDIVAHEMTHALLDGMYRRLQEVSNPDVPAFHEGFADIVALFQRFAIRELVRHELAGAGGRLDAATLLGGLARQFGEATGRGRALRDYLGQEIAALDYTTTFEVHDRGAILVLAVFRAFLKIVDRRTADLVRIATNGTGILPAGALHPDLVNRLTDETCKAANHVLRICIRALDYCPSVDITFGEYLRAIVTADLDLVSDDRFHYRLAFIEAFRELDILPRGVKTMSQETLAWGTLRDPKPHWLPKILNKLELPWGRDLDRTAMFQAEKKNKWSLWMALKTEFEADPSLCYHLGLEPGVGRYSSDGTLVKSIEGNGTTFEVSSVRLANRIGPDGQFRPEVIATIMQRKPVPMDPDRPDGDWFWFRGGATLIIDARTGPDPGPGSSEPDRRHIRYCIVKNISSETRLARQRMSAQGHLCSPLRELYFGATSGEPFARLHAKD